MAAQADWAQLVVDAVCRQPCCSSDRRHTLGSLVHFTVELVHEGREG